MYTLPQKKRNFFVAAFLLGKSVHHLILDQTSFVGIFDWGLLQVTLKTIDTIDLTLDQGRKPRGTGKNGNIKLAFLLGKSVLELKG